ncbi:MAG TPA: thiaminase II [Dehalococcoidia bacterium]|nr:thiaminase II [Dehalococcoidia bacterium]
MGKPFTQELWESIGSIYGEILRHPFLGGLTSGELPVDKFRYYVVQDALYLRDFARCLSLASAKSPTDEVCEMFAEHAKTALVVERALHESFFQGWGLAERDLEQMAQAPTCLAYTSYLLRVAYGSPFEELLSALLPCYWIYWEVGKELENSGSPNPLYQRWIDTYSSGEYAAVVRQVLDVMDAAAEGLPEPRRKGLMEHFVTTSRYEWMFWDAAWRLEGWPVS